MSYDNVTRFEVIDHMAEGWSGRLVVRNNCHVEAMLQDGGKTLKVFLTDPPKGDDEMNESTLHVGGWSSRCGACGKSCDPHSETHDVVLGYGPERGSPGCGARWTQVSSDYGMDLSDFRPDLPQVGPRQ